MQPDNIGKRLKRLRELRGLTIRALAIQAGVPQSTISQVEAGRRPGAGLRLDTAKRLSWALGVGLEALAGPYHEEEPEAPSAPAPLCHDTAPQRTDKTDTRGSRTRLQHTTRQRTRKTASVA